MPDPDGVRRVALVGYPGPSSSSDKIRLYTDLTFKTYLEVLTAAVARSTPSKAADENSPTVVVVDAGTKVDAVTMDRASGDAAFLAGPISASPMAPHRISAAPSVAGAAMPAPLRHTMLVRRRRTSTVRASRHSP